MVVSFQRLVAELRELDPQQPGDWPLWVQAVVIVFVCAALLILAAQVFWREQSEQIEAAKRREAQLRSQWLAKKKQAAFLPLYRAQYEEAKAQFAQLLERLPSRAEIAGLLAEVHRQGLERSLLFGLFRPGSEQLRDAHAELPVAIAVRGSYQAIGEFVSDLSNLERVVALADFSVSAKGNAEELHFEATLIAYRYLDEHERRANTSAAALPAGKGR